MTAPALADVAAVVPGPSDAELLDAVASLLAAMPGAFVRPRLSSLFGSVCSAYVPTAGLARSRSQELALLFADYLQGRHAVRICQATVVGMDAWASHAQICVVRCALLACARRLRAGGGVR